MPIEDWRIKRYLDDLHEEHEGNHSSSWFSVIFFGAMVLAVLVIGIIWSFPSLLHPDFETQGHITNVNYQYWDGGVNTWGGKLPSDPQVNQTTITIDNKYSGTFGISILPVNTVKLGDSVNAFIHYDNGGFHITKFQIIPR